MHRDAHKPRYKDSRQALVSKSIGQLSLTKKLDPGNLVIAIAGEMFDGRRGSSLSRPTHLVSSHFHFNPFYTCTRHWPGGAGGATKCF